MHLAIKLSVTYFTQCIKLFDNASFSQSPIVNNSIYIVFRLNTIVRSCYNIHIIMYHYYYIIDIHDYTVYLDKSLFLTCNDYTVCLDKSLFLQ